MQQDKFMGDEVILESREWRRGHLTTLVLKHRPAATESAWKVEHYDRHNSRSSFGFAPSFNDEAEARRCYAIKVEQEEARQAEWDAGEVDRTAGS